MTSVAINIFDKAKKKAAKEGVKRSSVRLDEQDDSDGLPFAPPPEGTQRLPLLKVVSAVLGTLLLAGMCSAVLAGSRSKPAAEPSPASLAQPASSPASSAGSNPGGNSTSGAKPVQDMVPAPLEDEIDPANIRAHLDRLYEIAMSNGGNRAMGNSGYNVSVQYVLSTLSTLSGLEVTTQDFVVSKNVIDASVPATLSFSSMPSLGAVAKDVDFATMANTGFGMQYVCVCVRVCACVRDIYIYIYRQHHRCAHPRWVRRGRRCEREVNRLQCEWLVRLWRYLCGC
jgi:hypothetical protein